MTKFWFNVLYTHTHNSMLGEREGEGESECRTKFSVRVLFRRLVGFLGVPGVTCRTPAVRSTPCEQRKESSLFWFQRTAVNSRREFFIGVFGGVLRGNFCELFHGLDGNDARRLCVSTSRHPSRKLLPTDSQQTAGTVLKLYCRLGRGVFRESQRLQRDRVPAGRRHRRSRGGCVDRTTSNISVYC